MTDSANEVVVKLPEIILGIVRDDTGRATHVAIQVTTFLDIDAARRLGEGLEDVADAAATYKGGPVGDSSD